MKWGWLGLSVLWLILLLVELINNKSFNYIYLALGLSSLALYEIHDLKDEINR